jgi:hypothetical protein
MMVCLLSQVAIEGGEGGGGDGDEGGEGDGDGDEERVVRIW